MSKILQNIVIDFEQDIKGFLKKKFPLIADYRILKKSIDARSQRPKFVYTIEIVEGNESLKPNVIEIKKVNFKIKHKPIIIGSGPAGLFAALRFVESGVPCVLFERGSNSENRIKYINQFWRYGKLHPENNVCFGEGGAGLYSDGKLITRIKSPHIPYVLQKLVNFGAPQEIEFLSNPHVGSDKIRRLIPKLRNYLMQMGCEIFFDTRIDEFIINGDRVTGVKTQKGDTYFSESVILATGHSATDVFDFLKKQNVFLEGKSFAMGLRIEHSQQIINQAQYGQWHDRSELGAANYKLTLHNHKTGVGVYSFCMCPGGLVLSSGTEAEGLVCNGMSNYNRNSGFANSAIVVSIDHQTHFGSDVWGGMKLRAELEKRAYHLVQSKQKGSKALPAQRVLDFKSARAGGLPEKVSSPSGALPVRLDALLPSFILEPLKNSLEDFNNKISGFSSENAIFYGVESRTSCPLRVTRDAESYESLSHRGLYPCGEGAGYAGGITSAACDGVEVADKIIQKMM